MTPAGFFNDAHLPELELTPTADGQRDYPGVVASVDGRRSVLITQRLEHGSTSFSVRVLSPTNIYSRSMACESSRSSKRESQASRSDALIAFVLEIVTSYHFLKLRRLPPDKLYLGILSFDLILANKALSSILPQHRNMLFANGEGESPSVSTCNNSIALRGTCSRTASADGVAGATKAILSPDLLASPWIVNVVAIACF